jgi:hypothetical protein
MPENEVLVEEVSPNGNILAAVEHDGRSVYFYLHGAPDTEFGVRTCWVRNLRQAPATLEDDVMRRGEQPMLPVTFCSHPQGAALPDPSTLRVVWFEEGDVPNLLWMIPITNGERELAMREGSEELARAIWASGAGWVHRDRDPVA